MDVKMPKKISKKFSPRVDVVAIPEKKKQIANYEQRRLLRALMFR
jgi:hypothetical protein